MKPYPAYKPTGLAWLPEVPREWEMLHVRELFSERREKVSDDEYEPLSVSRGGVVPQMESVAKSDDGDNRKRVCKGDFVINSRSDRKASSGVSPLDGSVSLVNIVLQPRGNYIGSYVHYLLKSNDFVEEYYRNGRGIVADLWTTRFSEMKSISLPVPTKEEQAIIASYLDEKTAKIDRLIELKEREINLYKEKVVRLATDCQDSPSQKSRIKRLFRLVRDEVEIQENDFYMPVGVLNRGRGVFHKDVTLGKDMGESEFFRIYPGDLLISGQFAWEGSFAVTGEGEQGCVASHRYYSLRPNNDMRVEYLWAFFQTQYGDLIANLCSHGAAGRNKPLNIDELMNVYVPFPDIDKQNEIAEACLLLFRAVEIRDKYVSLLKEYRTRLISDAVTGRIDLRKEVA